MNLLRTRYNYFNVTVIDAEGKPTTTQLYTGDPTLPVEWVVNRVTANGNDRRSSVIAAYIFDTAKDKLRQFVVVAGRLVEVASLSASAAALAERVAGGQTCGG